MSQHNLVEYPIKYLSAESTAVLWEYIKKYIAKEKNILPASVTVVGSPDIQDNSRKVATTEYVVSSLNKALKEFKVMQYKGTVASTIDLDNAETSVGSTYIASAPFTYVSSIDSSTQQISAGDMFIRNNEGWDIITSGSYSNISSTTVGDHTDEGIVIFDGKTGRFVKNSGINISRIPTLEQNLTSGLSAASSDRTSKYNTLDTKINTNTNSLNGLITDLETRIAAEETKRDTDDKAINKKIDEDISTAIDEINTKISTDISTAISDEVTARENADSALSTRISGEVTARQNAISAVESSIADEVERATGVESTLLIRINSEESARKTAVAGVQSNINTEISDRESADSALDAKIDNLKSYSDGKFETQTAATNSYAAIRNEITDAISSMKSTSFKIVDGVDLENNLILEINSNGNITNATVPNDGIIYLVPSSRSAEFGGTGISGSYVEYIKITTSSSYALERIGSITSDLASYYTKAEIDSKFSALPIKSLDTFPYPGTENTIYIRNSDSTVWIWSKTENNGVESFDYVQLGAKDEELREVVTNLTKTVGNVDSTVSISMLDTLINSVGVSTVTEGEGEDAVEVAKIEDFKNITSIPSYIKALLAYEAWTRRNEDTKITDSLDNLLDKKLDKVDIVDNLTSTSANNKPLSAAQGSVLSGRIETIKTEVNNKITNIGNVFSFKGVVDTPDDLPNKTTLSTLSVGDVYQVKSSVEKYTAVDSTSIVVGTTAVDTYYTKLSETEYTLASGTAVEGTTYYTKSYEPASNNTYATYSYIQTNLSDDSTGSWAPIAVSISNITSYFSTQNDANTIITECNAVYGND